MARTGITLQDVQQARDAVLLDGQHPSIDTIRARLGNTGSKTTISRFLKLLDADVHDGFRPKLALSEPLTDLIGRLVQRLQDEADQYIADATAPVEEQLRQRDAVVTQLRQEQAQLSAQLQRLQTDLQAKRLAHDSTQQQLIETTSNSQRQAQQISDLHERLADLDRFRQSLEDKHQHAREALEHFRQAAKEQREQDQRQHEQQTQQLQLEVRTLNQTIIVKQHELTTTLQAQERVVGELVTAEKNMQALAAANAKLESEKERAKQKVTEMEAAAAVAADRQQRLQDDSEHMQRELQARDSIVRQHELTIARLQTKLNVQAQWLPQRNAETMREE